MKTVVLDGFAVNPGDLSWDFLAKYGEYDVYDKTPYEMAAEVISVIEKLENSRVNFLESFVLLDSICSRF